MGGLVSPPACHSSEIITVCPVTEYRCTSGKEPSYLPPAPPPPAPAPCSLPFMLGSKTGYLAQDQIQISEHRWRP